jgi:hypothetical protein
MPAVEGGCLCTTHARLAAQGHTDARGRGLVLVSAGQRERYVGKRVTCAAPHKRDHVQAVEQVRAAPHELGALPVWRMCTGQRERAALAGAWAQRDTHPGAWRDAVRKVLAAAKGEEGSQDGP